MKHHLSEFRVKRSGRTVAYCSDCDKEVGVIERPTMGGKRVRQVCAESVLMRSRATAKKDRVTSRRKEARVKKRSERELQQSMEWLWRQIVYVRAGRCCEVPGCGKTFAPGDFQLQAHHLVKRSQSARLQLDPWNGMAACAGHHQYADRDQMWAVAIVDEIRPGTMAYLARERRSTEGRRPIEEEVITLVSAALLLDIEIPESITALRSIRE